MIQLVTDGQTGRQKDQSDFIGCSLTNVEHPKLSVKENIFYLWVECQSQVIIPTKDLPHRNKIHLNNGKC